jgi:two-component system, response regulator
MSNKYILLVEDNPDDISLTRIAFKKCQLAEEIEVVVDGEAALDFLFCRGEFAKHDHHGNPSLVLLDLKLPRLNGLEVLREIRANAVTSSIPIVILSSSIGEKEMQDSYALGANKFYSKPVSFDRFVELVCEIKSNWLDEEESSLSSGKTDE